MASRLFQMFILAMILIAAILVGLETYPSIESKYGGVISQLNEIILWMFAIEAALKMGQHGRHFYRYFQDPWNVFDFLIVVICFLPIDATYAAVLRLARVMRALRLLTAVPKLQVLVGALLRSIPSMGYIGLLLFLNFYVYAIIGVFLFRDNDPVHFQDLQISFLTLFRVVTLEDWTDVMYIQMYGSDVYPYDNISGIEPSPEGQPIVGALYFVSFVLMNTMIVLNLFIGVILNSMDEANAEKLDKEKKKRRVDGSSTDEELDLAIKQIDQLSRQLSDLRARMKASQ
ncbi:MAG: ion transporter [Planctomycetota bacterium]